MYVCVPHGAQLYLFTSFADTISALNAANDLGLENLQREKEKNESEKAALLLEIESTPLTLSSSFSPSFSPLSLPSPLSSPPSYRLSFPTFGRTDHSNEDQTTVNHVSLYLTMEQKKEKNERKRSHRPFPFAA